MIRFFIASYRDKLTDDLRRATVIPSKLEHRSAFGIGSFQHETFYVDHAIRFGCALQE